MPKLRGCRLVASGFINREIAIQSSLSPKSIETYKARAMEKLGFGSRVGLVAYAVRAGWLTGG